ncbi:MAG: PQQ-binding-like beta-propeller repeat protein [Euryarchaeota archaeon]|nr:PQQ-binding-like beta-propeller repeat protein [Euryarchaeota archaeon]
MSPIARSIATTTVVLLIVISVLLLPAAAEYLMFHNDPERTGNVGGDAPVTGDLLWKTALHDTGYVGGGACIAGGRVYVSNWAGWPITDERGLYCLNETTGEIIWWNPIGGMGGVSTPAISGDRVFVGSCTGDLYCVNASDGATIWDRTIEPDPLYWGVGSSPLIYDGTIFVNTVSDGALYAFNFDGSELWKIATTTGSYSGGSSAIYYISPAAHGGMVFWGAGPALYCADIATHGEVWNFSTSGTISTTPAISGGMVFFATDEPGERLYALYLDGGEAWNTSMRCRLSSPAVAHGRVYIGDMDKHLNCLDSGNGSVIWSKYVGGPVKSSPVVAGGMVYVTEYTGTIYCFDADCGTFVWSGDTEGFNIAQPAVSDGTLFVGSDSGYLYAFRDPPPLEGDLNHDSKVTAADAVVALRMVVGAVPAVDEADVGGDGMVTSLDVLMILQVAAGSINA